MTENIPQTSASERIEAARKVLNRYDSIRPSDDPGFHMRLSVALDAVFALRALIDPFHIHVGSALTGEHADILQKALSPAEVEQADTFPQPEDLWGSPEGAYEPGYD
jgi:hypothetical protein